MDPDELTVNVSHHPPCPDNSLIGMDPDGFRVNNILSGRQVNSSLVGEEVRPLAAIDTANNPVTPTGMPGSATIC